MLSRIIQHILFRLGNLRGHLCGRHGQAAMGPNTRRRMLKLFGKELEKCGRFHCRQDSLSQRSSIASVGLVSILR